MASTGSLEFLGLKGKVLPTQTHIQRKTKKLQILTTSGLASASESAMLCSTSFSSGIASPTSSATTNSLPKKNANRHNIMNNYDNNNNNCLVMFLNRVFT